MKGEKMKTKIKLIVAIDLLFIMLLSLAGLLSGWAWQVARAAIFIILTVLSLLGIQRIEKKEGEKACLDLPLGIGGKNLLLTLPTIAPSVLLIFGVSALTSLILTSMGAAGDTVADAPIWEMLLIHALIPAVLEEALFRLVPMRALSGHSPGLCVILSGVFFAFIHGNLYSIPYALVAGIIFMALDLAFDSIIPSLILHTVNNTMSVIWIKYCDTTPRVAIYLGVLGGISLISAIVMILLRRKYRSAFAPIFKKGSGESVSEWAIPSIVLVGVCLAVAIINLIPSLG